MFYILKKYDGRNIETPEAEYLIELNPEQAHFADTQIPEIVSGEFIWELVPVGKLSINLQARGEDIRSEIMQLISDL